MRKHAPSSLFIANSAFTVHISGTVRSPPIRVLFYAFSLPRRATCAEMHPPWALAHPLYSFCNRLSRFVRNEGSRCPINRAPFLSRSL
eukprot:6184418-Pleurochrysis_carterae.AAC.2